MANSDKDIKITPNTGQSDSPKIEVTGADNATKTLTINDDGSITFDSDLTVQGNFTVSGTTTTFDTDTLNVQDNIITVNEGETGAGVTAGTAGIEVDRGTETNATILYDESIDGFVVDSKGSGRTAKFVNTNGYIELGPQNTSYAHITTDRARFYFNRDLVIGENAISSYNGDFSVRRSQDSSEQIVIGDNSMTFTSAGNDVVTVDGTNTRLGIATTSPSRPLHVVGDAYVQNGDILLSRGNYYLQDASLADYRGSFASAGVWAWENVNIGIGTTAPVSPLHIDHNVSNPSTDAPNSFGIYIDSDLTGSTATGGDREQGGIFIDLDTSATGGDASDEHRPIGVWADVRINSESDADAVYGIYGYTEAQRSGATGATTGLLRGGYFFAGSDETSDHTVSDLTGALGYASIQDAGTVSTSEGLRGYTNVHSSRTTNVGNLRGVSAEVDISGSRTDGSDITTGYSAVFHALLDHNPAASGEGTVTVANSYLYYGTSSITDSSQVTNNYGLYLSGEDKNYFSGSVGIGLTAPTDALHIRAASDHPLVIENTTNAGYAGIQFSDNSTGSYAQKGEFRFNHADGSSEGSGASFHFTTTESDLSIVGGKFIASDSSASEPGFAFSGDVNTGLFQIDSDDIALVTVGTERLTVTNSGNVGIGTTAPDQLFHVVGSANDDTVALFSTTGGTGGSTQGTVHIGLSHFSSDSNPSVRIGAEENGTGSYQAAMTFGTRSANSDSAPAERMRITHDGNVGIGNTNPTAKLHITSPDTAAEAFRVDVTDTDSTADSTPFVIDGDGRVGIGTASPVAGSALTLNGDGTTYEGIAFQSGGSTKWKMSSDGSAWYHDSQVNTLDYNIRLRDSTGTYQVFHMNADTAGQLKVGIGTTSPTVSLDVNGDVFIGDSSETTALSGSADLTLQGDTALATFKADNGSSGDQIAGIRVFADSYRSAGMVIGDYNNTTGATTEDWIFGRQYASTNKAGIFAAPENGGDEYITVNSDGQKAVRISGDNDDIDFQIKGTSSTYFHADAANERIGIGNTSPSTPLHISSTTTTLDNLLTLENNGASGTPGVGIKMFSNVGTTNYLEILHDAFGATNFKTVNGASTYNKQMHLQSDGDVSFEAGNVGIGTSSPSTALEVSGTLTVGNAALESNQFRINNTGGYAQVELGGSSGAYIDMKTPFSDDYDARIITAGSDLQIITASASTPIRLKTQGTTRLTVEDTLITSGVGINVTGDLNVGSGDLFVDDSAGRVGIGTTSPQANLHISSGTSGDAVLILEADTDNNNETDQPYIVFEQDGGIQNSAVGLTSGTTTDNNALVLSNSVGSSGVEAGIVFKTGASTNGYTNATESMRIYPQGETQARKTRIEAVSSNTTLGDDDSGKTIYWTGGTLTLPATAQSGQQFVVINNTGASATPSLGTSNSIATGWSAHAAMDEATARTYIAVAANTWIYIG